MPLPKAAASHLVKLCWHLPFITAAAALSYMYLLSNVLVYFSSSLFLSFLD